MHTIHEPPRLSLVSFALSSLTWGDVFGLQLEHRRETGGVPGVDE